MATTVRQRKGADNPAVSAGEEGRMTTNDGGANGTSKWDFANGGCQRRRREQRTTNELRGVDAGFKVHQAFGGLLARLWRRAI